jgi:NitT/TauT family transport system ATP-binding protein
MIDEVRAGAMRGIGLACHGIGLVYAGRRSDPVAALEDVSFSARPGEFLSVVGPSGCGKTTLLRIIAGLVAPTAGEVRFSDAVGTERGRTALVFQEHGLFPWLTVIDNVAFGLEMQGMGRVERQARAMTFVERVGLERFAHRYPHEISVGMRQRVGIARAFVSGAPILLMDEPFGALDVQTKWVLQEDLLHLWQEDRKLVLFVTHDIEEAALLSDRVLVMTGHPGRIREEIRVDAGRPRDRSRRNQWVGEIKDRVWRLLEEEVRHELWVRE